MQAPLLKVAGEWLEAVGTAELAASSRRLSTTYRSGLGSKEAGLDLRAYLAARLPATYRATAAVVEELAKNAPELEIRSVLDLGAGPGTASWAAAGQWPDISSFTMVDEHPQFLAVATELKQKGEVRALTEAEVRQLDFLSEALPEGRDLVIAAYSMTEVPDARLSAVVAKAWGATAKALVIVEPGTPVGFARILAMRQHLTEAGAHLLAPCPHHGTCPVAPPDWCHFSVRLPRSRSHMHAKQASVPWEDEKFAYLIATKRRFEPAQARIIRPPRQLKHGLELYLCTPHGLQQQTIARRDKAAYRLAHKLVWGDRFPASTAKEYADDT